MNWARASGRTMAPAAARARPGVAVLVMAGLPRADTPVPGHAVLPRPRYGGGLLGQGTRSSGTSDSARAAAPRKARMMPPAAEVTRAVPTSGARATSTDCACSTVTPASAAAAMVTAYDTGGPSIAISAASRTSTYVCGSRPERSRASTCMAKIVSSTGVSPAATRSRVCSGAVWVMAPPAGRSGDRSSFGIPGGAGITRRGRGRSARGPAVERGVQRDGGVDERQVGERLGEVADLLAGEGDLLGVQPDVVAVREHLLEGGAGVLHAAGAGEGVDVGEGAQREGALRAAQAVGRGRRVVPVDQAVAHQFLVHGTQGRLPAWVASVDEADGGHAQQRGVQHVGVVVLDERLARCVEA